MRPGAGPQQRRVVACAAVLALLAFSVLLVVPHSWHKEDGKRECVVCQAYRTPPTPAQAVIELDPPAAGYPQAPEPAPLPASRTKRTVYISRAPPF